jgi:hypothetical protein
MKYNIITRFFLKDFNNIYYVAIEIYTLKCINKISYYLLLFYNMYRCDVLLGFNFFYSLLNNYCWLYF